MSWYILLFWFRKKEKVVDESKLVLRCDNPFCRREIKGDIFAYSRKYKELYHVEDCPTIADSYRVQKSGEPPFSRIIHINRYFAVNLYKTRRLVQSSGIEKKLE